MCQETNRTDIPADLEQELRVSFRRGLCMQENDIAKKAGIDCLREVQNLTLPVIKPTVVKYAALKWLLNQACKFQEGVVNVEDIHNWEDNENFKFIFCEKPFTLTVLNLSPFRKFRLFLHYDEGCNFVTINYDDVPEFCTRRMLNDNDETFILELYQKFQRIFYDKVFIKVLYGAPIENTEWRESELRLPSHFGASSINLRED